MKTTRQPQMGLTFEQVWAALMELSEKVDKTTAAVAQTTAGLDTLEAKVAQTTANVDKTTAGLDTLEAKVAQTTANVDKTTAGLDTLEAKVAQTIANVDKVSKNVGGLNRSMGELIETIIAAKLWEKFDAYAYNLKRSYQRVPLYDENSNVLTDIDILLSNGEYVMAVEVKRELDKKDDIDHHLKRMELIKKYPPAECKGKKMLGAMAGATVDPDMAAYAHSVGFFVLELTGESVHLTKTPPDFVAGQW
ncbi:hypothetical protein FACS1894102_7660 [Spirochaetia bacterium]|nr:hypothetical protein FACS1894102_7660 [Spirochaetia bacterium]